MVTPYYQDDHVTLYHGDSVEILPTLDIEANVLLTDPPYFKVKQEEWDNQWDKASEFLSWMGDFLDRAKPLLTPQASVWVFASPAMTSSVERLVGERFRVLNSIRWAKSGGDNLRRVSLPAMRSFVSIWEGIVFAEQHHEPFEAEASRLFNEIHKPIGDEVRQARESAGLTRGDLEIALGFASTKDPSKGTGICFRWEEGDCLPTETVWRRISEITSYPLRSYSGARVQWDRLTDEYLRRRESLEYSARRPFEITDRRLSEDIWSFPSVAGYPGKHPCEKPESLLRHMIQTSSRPSDLILDPFVGSGSTLLTAKLTGRKAVGVEKNEGWCEHAAQRLSQGTLDIFGEVA